MWKSWKEKIIDFFYEEVEPEEKPIDLPQRVESKHAPVKEKRSLTTEKRTASVASRHVDTKVAYQYPKSQTAPFRFPVISDQSQPVNNRLQKTGHHTKQQSIQRKLQAKTEAYASHQRYHVKSRGMKRKQHQKELEEVPAYVRRRLEMEQQREREQLQKIAQEKQQEKEEQQEVTPSTTINLEAIEHTKPEEL